MIVKDVLVILILMWILTSSFLNIKKLNISILDYALSRGFILWTWFCVKLVIVCFSIYYLIDMIPTSFLNYKLI